MNMMDHIRKSMNKDKTVVQEQVNPGAPLQVSDAPPSTANEKIKARINEAKQHIVQDTHGTGQEQPPTVKHETPIQPIMKMAAQKVVPVHNTSKINITAMADYLHRQYGSKTEELSTTSNQEKVKIGGKTPIDLEPELKNVTPKEVEPFQAKSLNKTKTFPNTEKENGEVESDKLGTGKKKKKVVKEGLGSALGAIAGMAVRTAAHRALGSGLATGIEVGAKHLLSGGKKRGGGYLDLAKSREARMASKEARLSGKASGVSKTEILGPNEPRTKEGQLRQVPQGASIHPKRDSIISGPKFNQQTPQQRVKNTGGQFFKDAKPGYQPNAKDSDEIKKNYGGGESGGHMSAASYRTHAGLPPAGADMKNKKPSSVSSSSGGKHSSHFGGARNYSGGQQQSTKMSNKLNAGVFAKKLYKATSDINASTPKNKLGQKKKSSGLNAATNRLNQATEENNIKKSTINESLTTVLSVIKRLNEKNR